MVQLDDLPDFFGQRLWYLFEFMVAFKVAHFHGPGFVNFPDLDCMTC